MAEKRTTKKAVPEPSAAVPEEPVKTEIKEERKMALEALGMVETENKQIKINQQKTETITNRVDHE